MAKYKPFRNSTVVFATDDARNTARENARYGFQTSQPPQLVLSQNEPVTDWSYQRPRGGGYNEPFRAMDFIKTVTETQVGYDKGACAPIYVSVGQLTFDSKSQILLFGEGMSNGHRPDGKTWWKDRSLSLEELLKSASDYYGAYISFLLVDTSSGSYEKNLIVTNTTVRQFVERDHLARVFELDAQGATGEPAIPLLASARQNHIIRIIACLMETGYPTGTDTYSVITNNITTYISYSLGFVSGCDRASAKLESGEFKMDGTQITAMSVTATNAGIETDWNGARWRAYKITVNATFDTTNVPFSGREVAISGPLQLSNSLSFPFGPTPAEGTHPFEITAVASLEGSKANQGRMLSSTDYLWVALNNGSPIQTTVTANVTFTYPFNNPLTHAPVTTIIS